MIWNIHDIFSKACNDYDIRWNVSFAETWCGTIGCSLFCLRRWRPNKEQIIPLVARAVGCSELSLRHNVELHMVHTFSIICQQIPLLQSDLHYMSDGTFQ
jgi:hypothetical protein